MDQRVCTFTGNKARDTHFDIYIGSLPTAYIINYIVN